MADSVASTQQTQLLHLTILVNGIPEHKEYPANQKVEEVIKSLLPHGEQHNWGQYELRDRSQALEPARSLTENDVHEGDTLSLTKKDGGGGVA